MLSGKMVLKNRIGGLLLALLFVSGCGSAPGELQKGVDVMQDMLSEHSIARSAFSIEFPNGTPSQFVTCFATGPCKGEWPMPAEMVESDPQIKAMYARSLRPLPMLPKGVAFIANAPNPTQGMQVVYKPDDIQGMVIIEGYVNPQQAPVIVKKVKLPTNVQPDPQTKRVYENVKRTEGGY